MSSVNTLVRIPPKVGGSLFCFASSGLRLCWSGRWEGGRLVSYIRAAAAAAAAIVQAA